MIRLGMGVLAGRSLGDSVLQEGTQGPVPALVRLTVVSWVFSHDPSLPFSPVVNEHDLLGRCFETTLLTQHHSPLLHPPLALARINGRCEG